MTPIEKYAQAAASTARTPPNSPARRAALEAENAARVAAEQFVKGLEAERDELRAKYDELLVALHGIGAALGIPEGDRSPYSVTCGTLERVNRLAEIEAQEPVAKIHTDGYWTARRGYDPLSDGKAFLSVYASHVPAQAPADRRAPAVLLTDAAIAEAFLSRCPAHLRGEHDVRDMQARPDVMAMGRAVETAVLSVNGLEVRRG